MDLSKLSDADLRALYAQPDPRADMPAAGSEPVRQAAPTDVRQMSDEQLRALASAPERRTPGMLESAVSGAARGITFGYADELAGAVMGGLPGLVNGEGFQAGYQRVRDQARQYDKAADEAHPRVALGGKVAGNVIGAAPAMLAAPGLFGLAAAPAAAARLLPNALGATAGPLLPRMVMSGVGGAGLGAAQGFGEGEGDAVDQAKSVAAGIGGGAALGFASPLAGAAAGKVAAPLFQRLTNRNAPVPGVNNRGADLLLDDFNQAGGRPAIDARMAELGPDARLYNAGPTFEGSAQGLAVRPEAREIVMNDVRAQRGGSNARLASDLDAATFPAPVPSQVEAQFARQRESLQPKYARQEAAAREMTPDEGHNLWNLVEEHALAQKGGRPAAMLRDVEQAVAPTTRYPGGMAQAPDPTLQGLMGTRRVLDGHLATVAGDDALRASGVGARLQQVRQAVDDQIRAINPEIKNLDRAYETSAQSSEALRQGMNFMSRDVHPADVAARFNPAPMEQQAAERLGARARIDREVGNTNRDLVALKQIVKSDGTWNRDKLVTYFGEESADRIFKAVDREAAFEETARRVIDNSQTAQRTAAAARFEPRGDKTPDTTMAISSIGGPKAMALAAALKGFRGASGEADRVVDVARNRDIARILTQTSGPELTNVLDALGRRSGLAAQGDARTQNARLLAELLLRSNGNEAGQAARRYLAP